MIPHNKVAEDIDPSEAIHQDDIVVAIMGPRGAGKSHLIDLVAGQRGRRTGNRLILQIEATRLRSSNGNSVVLVELPGFGTIDGTGWSDLQVLQTISTWLLRIHENGVRLAGIVYVQRITDEPTDMGPMKNFRFLREIVGDASPRKSLNKKCLNLVLATTMWDRIDSRAVGPAREKIIQSKLWKPLAYNGIVERLGNEQEEGWRVLTKATTGNPNRRPLLLQEELINRGGKLKDTRAGRMLYASLKQFISDQEKTLQSLRGQNGFSLSKEQRQALERELADVRRDFDLMEVWVGKGSVPASHQRSYSTPQSTTWLQVPSARRSSFSSANSSQSSIGPKLELSENDPTHQRNGHLPPVQVSPLPSPPPRNELSDEVEQAVQLRNLLLQILKNGAKITGLTDLRHADAQCLVDFLDDQLLDRNNDLEYGARKHMLSLLSKVSRISQVFPATHELEGVDCDLRRPANGGGFGSIYKGTYRGQVICVKAVQMCGERDRTHNNRLLQAQMKELILWSHVSHENILPFYGFFFSAEDVPRTCIVSPWMDMGDLSLYLHKYPRVPRMPLITDIINGLQYLHESDVIHADLKAKNILISNSHRAMIADFGISSVAMNPLTTVAETSGTLYWMAPELLVGDHVQHTMKTDMWSFACLCYEVFTGKIPFHQFKLSNKLIKAFMDGPITPFTLLQARTADEGEKADVQKIDIRVRLLMELCWEDLPELRPPAETIRRAIARMRFPDERPGGKKNTIEAPIRRSRVTIDYQQLDNVLRQLNTDG